MLCWPRMGEALGIYSNACLQVAEVLRQYGFVWHTAQFKLVKKAGDLQLEFRFQSSHRNVVFNQPDAPPELGSGARAPTLATHPSSPDRQDYAALFLPLETCLAEIAEFGSVTLIAHASVVSRGFKAWKRTKLNDAAANGTVAGANVGYLTPQRKWLEVNLAHSVFRSDRIVLLAALLESVGLPFFDRFLHPKEALHWMIEDNLPGQLAFSTLEYAHFLGGAEGASAVLLLLLRQMKVKGWDDEYHRALAEYRTHGIPDAVVATEGAMLARTALMLDIE